MVTFIFEDQSYKKPQEKAMKPLTTMQTTGENVTMRATSAKGRIIK
jgi:hypothetical protein